MNSVKDIKGGIIKKRPLDHGGVYFCITSFGVSISHRCVTCTVAHC